MCCVISKTTAETRLAAGCSVESHCPVDSDFNSSIRHGMHALAQPITLLHSYFYLAGLEAERGTPMPQHFADAADGIAHLYTLFHLVQEIVRVQGTSLQVASVSADRAIAPLLEDAEAVLAGTGLRLLLAEPVPSCGPLVAVDLKLLRQAWTSLLHVVREACCARSAIRCSFFQQASHWVVCLAPVCSKTSPIEFDEASKLHLALGALSLEKQGACLKQAYDPFSLLAHFPVA